MIYFNRRDNSVFFKSNSGQVFSIDSRVGWSDKPIAISWSALQQVTSEISHRANKPIILNLPPKNFR